MIATQQCECGWNFTFTRDCVVKCPKCYRLNSLNGSGNLREDAIISVDQFEVQREYWRKLHRFPLSKEWNCNTRCKWWAHWNANVPNIHCDCRKHWKELIEKHPPTFTSRWAFFVWSVDRHNDVNVMLKKLVIPVELAVELYGDPRVLDLEECKIPIK